MILSRILFGVEIEIERTAEDEEKEKTDGNQHGGSMLTDFGDVIDNGIEITRWIQSCVRRCGRQC